MSATTTRPLRLFEGYGLEIELVLVDAATLEVVPIADRLLASVGGEWASDVADGDMGWSNELVLHVIEVKNERPVATLDGLAARFACSVERIESRLEPLGARLLPGGAHPWMDPRAQTRLWPHEYAEIYAAYDRLFDCRRHGWANLQSVHVNLPFGDEREFVRLHAAIRMVLPLIPGLAASSPVLEGRDTGWLDARLRHYRDNSARVPEMTGRVIPEPIGGVAEYHERVLEPIYRALRPLDPEGALHGEFANARGAIARFDRDAIEIRLVDSQECPRADVAVSALICEAVRRLADERDVDHATQLAWPTDPLVAQLDATSRAGPATPVADPALAAAFGGRAGCTVGDLWRIAFDRAERLPAEAPAVLEHVLGRGTLAQRLLAALDGDLSRPRLHRAWSRMADCLRHDRLFGLDG